jgi:hypothetical protein
MVVVISATCAGCANVNVPFSPILIAITGGFSSIQAGTRPVIVTANIQNDPGNGGVRWKLTQNGYACTPACGTINPALHPSVTALYTPPVDSLLSSGSRPTLTAIAVDDPSRRASLHFEITPPVKVVILNKFNAKYALRFHTETHWREFTGRSPRVARTAPLFVAAFKR